MSAAASTSAVSSRSVERATSPTATPDIASSARAAASFAKGLLRSSVGSDGRASTPTVSSDGDASTVFGGRLEVIESDVHTILALLKSRKSVSPSGGTVTVARCNSLPPWQPPSASWWLPPWCEALLSTVPHASQARQARKSWLRGLARRPQPSSGLDSLSVLSPRFVRAAGFPPLTTSSPHARIVRVCVLWLCVWCSWGVLPGERSHGALAPRPLHAADDGGDVRSRWWRWG
jgi:hypothetical protein